MDEQGTQEIEEDGLQDLALPLLIVVDFKVSPAVSFLGSHLHRTGSAISML